MMEPDPRPLLFLVGAGGTVIGVIFFFVGRHLRRDTRNPQSALVTTRATILKRFRKEGAGTWGGLENHFLMVRFTDDAGVPHETELHVQSRALRMLREGGTTSLNYPVGKPEQVRFGSVLATKITKVVGTMLVLLGIVSVILFVGSCTFTLVTGREL